MYRHVILLCNAKDADTLKSMIHAVAPDVSISVVTSDSDLETCSNIPSTEVMLLSFGTSVIISAHLLARFNAAYNFHSASPDYPGRDPHHYAIYDGVRRYGATAHIMTEKVDAGTIVDVEWFDVPEGTGTIELLTLANSAAYRLFTRLVPRLISGEKPSPLPDVKWGNRKTHRKDLLELCYVPACIDREELQRRIDACHVHGYANLMLGLHGYCFKVIEAEHIKVQEQYEWSGFTESAYIDLLESAKAHYAFTSYVDAAKLVKPHVLWRHDVDMSVHRAAKLARIEVEKGVCATYFLMLRSPFYNLHEPAVLARAREIVALGHAIGLHFDMSAYPSSVALDELTERLTDERDLLAHLLDCKIEAVSFHNPEVGGALEYNQLMLAGMVNAYAGEIKTNYKYCSDSNGYWRHDVLPDLLASKKHSKLHILTHPEWWTPTPMPPRERVERCVLGRASAVMRDYDDCLERSDRKNIGLFSS